MKHKLKRLICPLVITLLILLSIAVSHNAREARTEVNEWKRYAGNLERQLEEVTGALEALRSWMSELGLPITIEEIQPAVEEEGVPPSPEEAKAPASDFSAAGLKYSPQAVELYFPQGLEPQIDIYLGWRELYPEGYTNLIRWGRGEEPPLPLPPPMVEATRIAAAGQNIDDYMAHWPHSPLGGYGQEFAYAGWRYNVNPYLLIALTAAESTFATGGSLWRTNHNAWGMLGPNSFTRAAGIPIHNRGCWWPDWPTAIDGAAQFLNHFWPGARTAYDLRGYCAGNPPPWIRNVEVVRIAMGGVM